MNTLIEYFAAHETLADTHLTSSENLRPYAELLAGPRPSAGIEAVPEWDAKWRAKLRFIRAKAMVEEAERIRAESTCKEPGMGWYVAGVKTGFVADFAQGHVDPKKTMKAVFKDKTTNLSFGEALEAMKKGRKVKRGGFENVLWVRIGLGDVFESLARGSDTAFPCGMGYEDIIANDWSIVQET